MPTEVTRSIPVTACFDGCFCSDECEHFTGWCELPLLRKSISRTQVGRPSIDCEGGNIYTETTVTDDLYIPVKIRETYIRTRWCCETFGMCEQVQEQEQRDTTMDGVELETMDANDAEALRRWTSE